MKKTILYGAVAFLFIYFSANQALADYQYQFEKTYTGVSPIFMAGHDGDFNWIEGFNYSGEIYMNGNQIGTFTGQATIFNPPLNMVERYDQGIMRFTNTITGYGSFETVGQVLSMGTSGSVTTGDVTLVWQGSLSNGKDHYDDVVGLSAGTGSFNLFTTQGNGTEILLIRFGY